MKDQLLFSQIEAAKELTGGSTYRLKQLRDAGILEAPVMVEGMPKPMFTYEQLRAARNKAAQLAYAPTATIRPIRFDKGESL